MVNFEICQFLTIPGPFEYFSENGWSQKISFLNEGVIVTPLISLVLGGEVPRLNHGPICLPVQNTYGGGMGRRKSSTTFLTLL